MPIYISLMTYTDQGLRNVKKAPSRLDAARNVAEDLGGKLGDLYLTMGQYDGIATVEAPNDEALAKFVLTLGSAGNVRTMTLKGFTEREYREIVGSLP